MRRNFKSFLALALTLTLCLGLLPASALAVSDWAQAGVTEAVNAGIVPDGLPGDYTKSITRAEFCNLAVKLYETKTGAEITGRAEFPDTSDVNVQKVAYLGVVFGYDNGNFGPNDTLTREQAAAILSRLAGKLNISMSSAKMPFTDVSATSWARADIAKIYGIGVMMGTGNTTFSPSESYTIEQSILTVLRLYKIEPDESLPTPGDIVDSGSCGENLTWTLDSNGLLTISGTGEMPDYPYSITIGDSQYSNNAPWGSKSHEITNVLIEEGVSSIGECAFSGCESLRAVRIAEGVVSIGERAFSSCAALTSIYIPKSVEVIGSSALDGCGSLEKIKMDGAFSYTVRSLEDLPDFAAALYSVYPLYMNIYVPKERAGELSAEVEKYITASKYFSYYPFYSLSTIDLKNSEFTLLFIRLDYWNELDILPHSQGYLKVPNEQTIPLYEQSKRILSEITSKSMSEYQKVKSIHDYLVENTVFDESAQNAKSAIGPIIDGKAVCEGYAKAFQLLCVMSGIDCIFVTGDADGDHAWNKVKIGDLWYNVDVTWDDPIGGSLRHSYFLISDSELSIDHTWDNTYLPACPAGY